MTRSARATSSAPVNVNITSPTALEPEFDEKPLRISIWEAMSRVPDGLWWDGGEGKGYRVYLYDHEVPKSPYLEVINHPFDIEWVKSRYGGGTFRAHLNDEDYRIVGREIFAIAGEPKRKPSTSVQNAPAAALPADNSLATVLGQFVEVMREGQRENREILREALSNRNAQPAAGIDPTIQFKAMVECFMAMMPKQAGPSLTEMLALMDRFRPPDLLEVLTKAKTAGLIPDGTPAGSMMENLSGLLTVGQKLQELGWMGGNGGGKSWAELLVEKGPEIGSMFINGIDKYRQLETERLKTAQTILSVQQGQQRMNGNGTPQQPAAHAANPAQPAPAPAPVATRLEVEPIGADTAVGSATPIQPGHGGQVVEITQQQIDQIKTDIVQHIARGGHGEDIYGMLKMKLPEFLQGMCIFAGGKVVDVVSVDQLSQFCVSDSILSHAASFPRFKKTVGELLLTLRAETIGIDDDETEGPDQGV